VTQKGKIRFIPLFLTHLENPSFQAYDASMQTEGTTYTIEEFIQHARELGMKITPQRIEIYRQLVKATNHPDAETLYKHVRTKIPSISLDTVYRNLRTLEKAGLINRVCCVGDSAHYDAYIHHNQHFVCTSCGVIEDLEEENHSTLPTPKGIEEKCIQSFHVEWRGLCSKCRKNQSQGNL
jgi:Fur family peroxide stress response transcriptional regulator